MPACTGLSIEVKVRGQSKGTWKQWGGSKEPEEEEHGGEQRTGQVEHQGARGGGAWGRPGTLGR